MMARLGAGVERNHVSCRIAQAPPDVVFFRPNSYRSIAGEWCGKLLLEYTTYAKIAQATSRPIPRWRDERSW